MAQQFGNFLAIRAVELGAFEGGRNRLFFVFGAKIHAQKILRFFGTIELRKVN